MNGNVSDVRSGMKTKTSSKRGQNHDVSISLFVFCMHCLCVYIYMCVCTRAWFIFFLLAQGDVIALMGGDKAPCLAEVLRLEVEDDGSVPAGKIVLFLLCGIITCTIVRH